MILWTAPLSRKSRDTSTTRKRVCFGVSDTLARASCLYGGRKRRWPITNRGCSNIQQSHAKGLGPEMEHALTVRISEKQNELSKGNNCRIVYFGLNGDPRTPKGVDVDGVYFDGSNGSGPEK